MEGTISRILFLILLTAANAQSLCPGGEYGLAASLVSGYELASEYCSYFYGVPPVTVTGIATVSSTKTTTVTVTSAPLTVTTQIDSTMTVTSITIAQVPKFRVVTSTIVSNITTNPTVTSIYTASLFTTFVSTLTETLAYSPLQVGRFAKKRNQEIGTSPSSSPKPTTALAKASGTASKSPSQDLKSSAFASILIQPIGFIKTVCACVQTQTTVGATATVTTVSSAVVTSTVTGSTNTVSNTVLFTTTSVSQIIMTVDITRTIDTTITNTVSADTVVVYSTKSLPAVTGTSTLTTYCPANLPAYCPGSGCVQLLSDLNNCGSCGNSCRKPLITGICQNGSCNY